MKVGLETCAGINLIRRSQIPHVKKDSSRSGSDESQGCARPKVYLIGEVTLSLTGCGFQDVVAVDFVVVDPLVVPAFLCTPWIDKYVRSIDPQN
jgi:hypothetical protein